MQKTWKKLLFLVCGICITTGAFAAGDEGEGGTFDKADDLCEAFSMDPGNSPVANGYEYFDWSCNTQSTVCEDWRTKGTIQDDGSVEVVQACSNGTVEYIESYYMIYDHGEQYTTGPCSLESGGTYYRCKSGYYGNPTSCSSTCKLAPQNSTISSNGQSYTCNSGYTKLTVNGTASCCATSWTTLSRYYKYRACWPEGQTKSVGLYTCNEAQSYYATNSFNPASVTCTWNDSTNKASGCSGCTKCTTGTSYGDGTGTGVQIVYNTTTSTSTHSLYGTYLTACTKSVSSYRCKAGYWGSPTSSAGTCNECPKMSSLVSGSTATNAAGTFGTSAAGATSKTQCYASSGYNKEGMDPWVWNDGTGNFFWTVDNGDGSYSSYNCYYTN